VLWLSYNEQKWKENEKKKTLESYKESGYLGLQKGMDVRGGKDQRVSKQKLKKTENQNEK
jgi:hypothetical protein